MPPFGAVTRRGDTLEHYLLDDYEPNYSADSAMVLMQQTEIFKENLTITHDHDFYEFFLVEDGNALHIINGQCCVIERGSLALIRPSDIHCFMSYKSNTYKMYNVRYPISLFDKVCEFVGGDIEKLLTAELPVCVNLSEDKLVFFVKWLKDLNNMPQCPLRGSNIRMIISHVILELLAPKVTIGAMPLWMSRLLQELENSSDQPERFNEIVENSSISKEHICRSFRKYLGVTPSQYLNSIRIRRAAKLLESGASEIVDVCIESGFNNLGYFYRLFDNYYHTTPGEYQKKSRGKSI